MINKKKWKVSFGVRDEQKKLNIKPQVQKDSICSDPYFYSLLETGALSFALYFEKLLLVLSWFNLYIHFFRYALLAAFILIYNIPLFFKQIENVGRVIQDFQCCQNITLLQWLEYFFKRPGITLSNVVKELFNYITGFVIKYQSYVG